EIGRRQTGQVLRPVISSAQSILSQPEGRSPRCFCREGTQIHQEKSSAEYDEGVNLTIDLDREEDGRWIAEALELPGVMCYGQTREEAISNTERLAIEVIADRIAHQEFPSSALNVSLTIADEQLARQ